MIEGEEEESEGMESIAEESPEAEDEMGMDKKALFKAALKAKMKKMGGEGYEEA
jgi:hypothetical protein